jgi:hypothetical protein
MGTRVWTLLHVATAILAFSSVSMVVFISIVAFIRPKIDGVALWWYAFTGYTGYTVGIHTIAGCLVCLVGPFQLWAWLRDKHRTIHRRMGYIYLISECICLIAIISSYPGRIHAYILNPKDGSPVGPRFLANAFVIWLFELLTLLFAFWRIYFRRDFFWHRIGMMYNYAIMLSIPIWWTWYAILNGLNLQENPEAQPDVFLLAFINFAIVTGVLLLEFNQLRNAHESNLELPDSSSVGEPLLSSF